MGTSERRQSLKDALIAAAERAVAAHGLTGLKARELAAAAGCAVGAIYNAVEDLDALALAVNARTLAALDEALHAVPRAKAGARAKAESFAAGAVADLAKRAAAYLDFAAANMPRWRALFEHRLPEGKPAPDWYAAALARLFAQVEEPLGTLRPDLGPAALALAARSAFSAVHGIVALGLEEKLGVVPHATLRAQVVMFTTALAEGLHAARPRRGG